MLSDVHTCVRLSKKDVQQIHKLCGYHGRWEFVLNFIAKNTSSPQTCYLSFLGLNYSFLFLAV